MSKQLLKHGDIIESGKHSFEVVTISAQQDSDGKPINFRYELMLKSDVDAIREANEKAAEEAREAKIAARAKSDKA